MGSFSKRLKRVQDDNMVSEDNSGSDDDMVAGGEEEYDTADGSHGYNDYDEDSDDNERPSDGEEGDYDQQTDDHKDDEMEELEKEYRDLQNREKSLVESLKRHKDEDVLKGQAVKSQKALWDKTLELRFLLQKAFSNSNKLPQEPFRSLFCKSNEGVSAAYADLIASSKKTMDSLVDLQKAVLDNNPSIEAAMEGESGSSLKQIGASDNLDAADDEEWIRIAQMHSRIVPFRNKSVDKWQRKAEVNSGAAAKKGKLLAFNQNISEQVAMYMRDPSKMIKGMQMRRETVGVFGSVAEKEETTKEEGRVGEGDPELLDDLEFYQQLLKEFFDTVNPTSSETAFYALKKLQTKKRKVVDRRASKSRKIRYHVHEKIVNFMAPQPMELPPMAPKLFENLFGLRTQRPVSAT